MVLSSRQNVPLPLTIYLEVPAGIHVTLVADLPSVGFSGYSLVHLEPKEESDKHDNFYTTGPSCSKHR